MLDSSESHNPSDSLRLLADRLDSLRLPSGGPYDGIGRTRLRVVNTLINYLEPRQMSTLRPLTVVFVGPTGAGKSTLLNSVVGQDLSATGVLRPTTHAPHVYVNEMIAETFDSIAGVDCEVVPGRAPVLRSMTMVDTPDLDSTSLDHRLMAESLIDVADVVVFVSSALRYSDMVPWEVLRRAQSRGAPIVCVLNRVRFTSDGALNDFSRRLADQDIDGDVVSVSEHHISGGERVPPGSIRGLRQRLVEVVEDHHRDQTAIFNRVLRSALDDASVVIEAAAVHAAEASRELVFLSPPYLVGFEPGDLPVFELLARASRSRRRGLRKAKRLARDRRLMGHLRSRLIEAVRFEVGSRAIEHDRFFVPGEWDAEVSRWVETLDVFDWSDKRTWPLLSLLVRVSAASGETWPTEIVDALAPDSSFAGVVARSRDDLKKIVDRRLNPGIEQAPSVETAEAARIALNEVVSAVSADA